MSELSSNILLYSRRLTDRLIFLEKRSFSAAGLVLYPSEIHCLLIIKDKPGINLSAMAEELNITPGAVSQTLTKLEKKGAVIKIRDRYNKNELQIGLTDTGEEFLRNHQRTREKLKLRFSGILEKFSEEERLVILRFLKNASDFF